MATTTDFDFGGLLEVVFTPTLKQVRGVEHVAREVRRRDERQSRRWRMAKARRTEKRLGQGAAHVHGRKKLDAALVARVATRRLARLTQELTAEGWVSNKPLASCKEVVTGEFCREFVTPGRRVHGTAKRAARTARPPDRNVNNLFRGDWRAPRVDFRVHGIMCDAAHKRFVDGQGRVIATRLNVRQTREVIRLALVRGGIEENPGPPKVRHSHRRLRLVMPRNTDPFDGCTHTSDWRVRPPLPTLVDAMGDAAADDAQAVDVPVRVDATEYAAAEEVLAAEPAAPEEAAPVAVVPDAPAAPARRALPQPPEQWVPRWDVVCQPGQVLPRYNHRGVCVAHLDPDHEVVIPAPKPVTRPLMLALVDLKRAAADRREAAGPIVPAAPPYQEVRCNSLNRIGLSTLCGCVAVLPGTVVRHLMCRDGLTRARQVVCLASSLCTTALGPQQLRQTHTYDRDGRREETLSQWPDPAPPPQVGAQVPRGGHNDPTDAWYRATPQYKLEHPYFDGLADTTYEFCSQVVANATSATVVGEVAARSVVRVPVEDRRLVGDLETRGHQKSFRVVVVSARVSRPWYTMGAIMWLLMPWVLAFARIVEFLRLTWPSLHRQLTVVSVVRVFTTRGPWFAPVVVEYVPHLLTGLLAETSPLVDPALAVANARSKLNRATSFPWATVDRSTLQEGTLAALWAVQSGFHYVRACRRVRMCRLEHENVQLLCKGRVSGTSFQAAIEVAPTFTQHLAASAVNFVNWVWVQALDRLVRSMHWAIDTVRHGCHTCLRTLGYG